MKNIWLKIFWGIGVLSLLFILQIGLNILPKFNCNCEIGTIKSINNVILTLSFSFLAGLIVFLLVNYFPDKEKNEKTENLIKPDLKLLINEMYIFIFYMNWKYANNDNINNLSKDCFSNIQNFTRDDMEFRYIKKSNPNNTFVENNSEFEYFLNIKKEIEKLIVDIFLIPTLIFLNEDLISDLRKLKNCSLFRFAEIKVNIPVNNFDKQLYEFYELYKDIKQVSNIDIDEIEIK